ncbi:unnamed protein product, partial [Prunus brigantina]
VPLQGSQASITMQPHGPTARSSSHHPFNFAAGSEVYHHGSAVTHGETSHHGVATDYGPILEQINLVKDLGPGSYGEERRMDRCTGRQVERSQAGRVGTSKQEGGHEHVAKHAGMS